MTRQNFALYAQTLKTDLPIVEMPGGSLKFLGMSARTLESQPQILPHFEWHNQPEHGIWEVSAERWEVTSGKEKFQGEPPRA